MIELEYISSERLDPTIRALLMVVTQSPAAQGGLQTGNTTIANIEIKWKFAQFLCEDLITTNPGQKVCKYKLECWN